MTDFSRTEAIASQRGYSVSEDGTVSGLHKSKRSTMPDKWGYEFFRIKVAKDGRLVSKRVSVHRLQAYQKFGDGIFEKGMVVRHLDGNCKNNSAANIAIGTVADNAADSLRVGSIKRKADWRSVLSVFDETGSYAETGRRMKMNPGWVFYIVKNRRRLLHGEFTAEAA